MEWSEWHSLKSDGTIPAELLPCQLFQLRWFIEWDLTPPDSSFTENLTGRWRWQVKAGSENVYDSDVRVKGTAVWMGDLLISWWVDQQNTEVRTYTPERPTILGADPDAWTRRSDGTWYNPAEVGYVTGRSDSGGMGNEIPVYVDYDTCAYEIELEQGSKVGVSFHNVGGFWVVRYANIQIRTAGVGGFGTYTDEVGIYRIADPSLSTLTQRYSRDGGRNFEERRVPQRLLGPSISKEPTNVLIVAGRFAETGYRVIRSLDDGLTWEENPVTVWDASYSDAKMACGRDGAIITIARKGGRLWACTSRDGYARVSEVGEARTGFELAVDRKSGRLTATNGTTVTYESNDGGITWAQVQRA